MRADCRADDASGTRPGPRRAGRYPPAIRRGALLPKPPTALAILLLGLLPSSALKAEPAEVPTDTRQKLVSELRAGVLAHDVDGLWSGTRRESGVDWNAEIIFFRPGLDVLWGKLRPNLGASINDHGDTSKVYAGALWEFEWSWGFFFDAALGAALHDGKLDSHQRDRKELGSRVLIRAGFDFGFGFGPHRLMATFDHVSNAGLASPNQGLDTLGARYGYRF
jgi:hypothetical protein